MAATYIQNSTLRNPKAASFALGMKIFGQHIHSGSLYRDKADMDRIEAGEKPTDPALLYAPIAQFLFLKIGLLGNIDIVSGPNNTDVITLTMGRFSLNWEQKAFDAAVAILNPYLESDKPKLHPDHLYHYANPIDPIDVSKPWSSALVSLWDTHAAPIIAQDGGNMPPISITYQNKGDHYIATITVASFGACGGCGGCGTKSDNSRIEQARPLIEAALDQINQDSAAQSGFVPVRLGEIVQVDGQQSRVVLKAPKPQPAG